MPRETGLHAQSKIPWGPSDPSEVYDCGQYQWPEVLNPCPEVQIKQKHDHTPRKQYRAQGWDTVVTCDKPTIVLSCMPYLPVQFFNGQYTVDTIPYDPPDTTFALGNKMPVSTDDDFAGAATDIPFNFFFFGLLKDKFVLGANGLITFNTESAGKYCPWKYNSTIPWNASSKNAPSSSALGCSVNNMRDAIYGIYEDTHPLASYLSGDQGIYYGVQDNFPCRKIICSWNGIPTFPGSKNKNNRCTYQIVCYEGSNIIEVHVKRRGVNTNWQSGNGLIGIQNATGEPQERGDEDSPNRMVWDSAYAAYYPAGGNLTSDSMDHISFRFTPQGRTSTTYRWYRIFDDGRDSIDIPNISNGTSDTNGFFAPMGVASSTCPTLTTATVSPTETSTYVFNLKFFDAAGVLYNLFDTIVVGLDTLHDLTLRPTAAEPGVHEMDICVGQTAQITMEYPQLQEARGGVVEVYRIENGNKIMLADSLLEFGKLYTDVPTQLKRTPLVLRPDATSLGVTPGKVDSIYIHMNIDFVSGCSNNADLLVKVHPVYDTTEVYGICKGETFHWELDGNNYSQSTTDPVVNVGSVMGCDSLVHLDLTVFDDSYNVDVRRDCKPLTWLNGKTYSQDNTATAATDTVVLTNSWGCDSIVQLDFQIRPMTPIIYADREFFDYEHLEVELTDVSTGGDSRRWIMPNHPEMTDPVVHYTIPYELDSARIMMIESSSFGCQDTDYITLQFHRDVIWFPNVFTPTADENNRFGSNSRHLLKQQTVIYNRFGALVFQCDEIDCQWDGTNLRGELCPQGTYVYIVRYTTVYEPLVTHTVKGTVTIID